MSVSEVTAPQLALTLQPRVTVGDLLTVVTIAVSAVSLFIAWHGERRARDRERANAVRTAATETVAKLERWQELAVFYYNAINPLLIDVSNMLSRDDVGSSEKRERVRDALWRGLTETRTPSQQRILEEDIELAYVGLQAYDQRAYEDVSQLVRTLREIDEKIYTYFVEREAQPAVLQANALPEPYRPSGLGNRLRKAALTSANTLTEQSAEAIGPLRKRLLTRVATDDKTVLWSDTSAPAELAGR